MAKRHRSLTAVVDTNVLVRHLTGEPSQQAERATAFLSRTEQVILTDLVLAETVYVLESFYERPRSEVAHAMRSLLAMPSLVATDVELLLRALELYESGLHFADAYIVAAAERWGVGRVASFDAGIDAVGTVERVEP